MGGGSTGALYPREFPSGEPREGIVDFMKLSSAVLELGLGLGLESGEDLLFFQPFGLSLVLLTSRSSSQPDLSSRVTGRPGLLKEGERLELSSFRRLLGIVSSAWESEK